MELSRNAKILCCVFKSVEVEKKKGENAERITFTVNGIRFTTNVLFKSERGFLDDFLHCEKITCKHCFEEDMRDVEEIKPFLVFLEGDDVMIVAL